MRGAISGSLAAHLALLALLFVVRPPRSISLPGAEVVKVALVDASQLPSAPSPPPRPVAAPPDEQGVRLPDMKPAKPVAKPTPERPKTPPKTKPVTQETPPHPPTPPGATTLAPARLGTTGLVGSMGVDATDFPFSYYLVLVRDRIAGNWQPPAGLGAGQPIQALVYFRIGRSGAVTGARLETASGTEFFDRAALRAVMLSDPMPPLPAGFPGDDLGVHFGFEWESP